MHLVAVNMLNVIKADCKLHGGLVACCRIMLQAWQDHDIQASWRQLVEALRAINQHTLVARDEVWLLPSHGEPPSLHVLIFWNFCSYNFLQYSVHG